MLKMRKDGYIYTPCSDRPTNMKEAYNTLRNGISVRYVVTIDGNVRRRIYKAPEGEYLNVCVFHYLVAAEGDNGEAVEGEIGVGGDNGAVEGDIAVGVDEFAESSDRENEAGSERESEQLGSECDAMDEQHLQGLRMSAYIHEMELKAYAGTFRAFNATEITETRAAILKDLKGYCNVSDEEVAAISAQVISA